MITKYYIVWCDEGNRHGYKARDAKTINGAREEAIKFAGWAFWGYPGRDLCPYHQDPEHIKRLRGNP